MDKHIVVKLISGEELVCTYLNEDDYQLNVLFPMIVKHIPRAYEGRLMESISLAPYTYFASDDEFSFQKNQIIFIKEMNPMHLDSYNAAIDDFVGAADAGPATVEELKQISDKLSNMFKDKVKNEEFDDSMLILDQSKLIH
jgi:hypothetical protein